jgi:5-methylcytosine-specific restriction endonuclease McrA
MRSQKFWHLEKRKADWANHLSELASIFLKDAERTKKAKPERRREKKKFAPSPNHKDTFYQSWEWQNVRMEAFKRYGRHCQCCGASHQETRMTVDHIEPISRRWDRRLDITNLQILCASCNQGKGAWDRTDWRP